MFAEEKQITMKTFLQKLKYQHAFAGLTALYFLTQFLR